MASRGRHRARYVKHAASNRRWRNYFLDPKSAVSVARNLFARTRVALWIHHSLDLRKYGQSFQLLDDKVEGYILASPSAEWKGRLRQVDGYAADMEERAKAAGTPFVVCLLPTREQAIMISRGDWPAGINPFGLDDELRRMIISHGGAYVSIMREIKEIPNIEEDFYQVDGHPNPDGDAMFSMLLARELTNGAIPALRAANPSSAALKKGQ